MNVFIDIETIPQQPEEEAKAAIRATIEAPGQMKKEDTINAWHNGEGQYAGVKDALVEEAYRKTSFDGSKGQICSIAWAVENGDIQSVAGMGASSESLLLHTLFSSIQEDLKDRPPYFIGHYISGFDLKFLFHRAVINNIKPPFDLCQWGRHNSNFYDTMTAWAGYGGKISQDNLCKALGIEGKPDGIDGSKVWDYYKEGRINEIQDYNKDDVDKVRKIYNRLTFGG